MDDALREYIESRERALAAVRKILIENLKVDRPADSIDPDVILFGSGVGLDSVDALELVVALESRFGVRIDEDEFRTSLRTVNSLVDRVLAEGRAETGA